MGLSVEVKEERIALLTEAKVSERFRSKPLSKCGEQGAELRSYMTETMKQDRENNRGLFMVSKQSGLAQSFARDMAISKTGIRFCYLQTFAEYYESDSFTRHMGYVVEWFEQADVQSPFTSKERYKLETDIIRMIDAGRIFYLFSEVPPRNTAWWSTAFINYILENNSLIIGGNGGGRSNSERTLIRNTKKEGPIRSKSSKRVTIR